MGTSLIGEVEVLNSGDRNCLVVSEVEREG